MPSKIDNKKKWDGEYDWNSQGNEWSQGFGGPFMQWNGSILPRIKKFIPANSILEIACGHGRWTHFLIDLCRELSVVDLSEECIEACKKRFKKQNHINYHVNDGKSLDMIPDNSIDFIFSYDSLVHVNKEVIDSYLSQFPRILKKNGAAFIHHSNLGDYSPAYLKLHEIPVVKNVLKALRVIDKNLHWRDPTVSAGNFQKIAEKNSLKCISQEIIHWNTNWAKIDCFSVMVNKESELARKNCVVRNENFNEEIKNLSQLSALYSPT